MRTAPPTLRTFSCSTIMAIAHQTDRNWSPDKSRRLVPRLSLARNRLSKFSTQASQLHSKSLAVFATACCHFLDGKDLTRSEIAAGAGILRKRSTLTDASDRSARFVQFPNRFFGIPGPLLHRPGHRHRHRAPWQCVPGPAQKDRARLARSR